jgi:uncharacterized protein
MTNNEFEIAVSPKSSKSEISINGDNIKIYLNSPPADGKANSELIKMLSKELHIAKSGIKIVRGEKSRKKIISIEGFTKKEVIKLLSSSSD